MENENDIMQQLTESYNTSVTATQLYDTLNAELQASSEPAAPLIVTSSEQWEEYATSVSNYRAYVEATQEALTNHRITAESARQNMLRLLPAKAIWFKLTDVDIWLAKVSNTLMDTAGNNLIVATNENDLTQLNTL